MNCARYLRRPKKYVIALSGKQSLEDNFVVETIDGDLDAVMSLMYRDSAWGGYMPLSLKAMSRQERLFIVKLYEAATGKMLLPDFGMDIIG